MAPPGFPVQVKVDTGMHRVGAPPVLAAELARRVAASPLHLQGIWTHFAVAEEDPAYTATQLRGLRTVVEALAARGVRPEMVHAANTAGGPRPTRRPASTWCAPASASSACAPPPSLAPEVPLRPAMRVVSQVAYLQRLPGGARPSYGRRRPLPGEATVATIPMGYADGVPRRLAENGGTVLIGGKRHPFAGTITMDQIVVDVGDHPVAVGDEVVLLGRQGGEEITADEWAGRLGVHPVRGRRRLRPPPAPQVPAVTLTAVPGVRVGHWTDPVGLTGVTVVVLPQPNVTTGEVRGAAPGTRETALLAPGMKVEAVQAIALCGGSAFGLAAADGVMAELEADGIGYPTPAGVVPIVPAAVIFDLAIGDPRGPAGPRRRGRRLPRRHFRPGGDGQRGGRHRGHPGGVAGAAGPPQGRRRLGGHHGGRGHRGGPGGGQRGGRRLHPRGGAAHRRRSPAPSRPAGAAAAHGEHHPGGRWPPTPPSTGRPSPGCACGPTTPWPSACGPATPDMMAMRSSPPPAAAFRAIRTWSPRRPSPWWGGR